MREKVLFSSLTIHIVVSSDYATYGTDDAGKNQLSDKVRRDMIYIQSKEPNAKFGLGWEVYNNVKGGDFVLLHSGSDPGVRTVIALLPSSKQGLVIFTNSDNGIPFIKDLIKELLDIGEALLQRVK